jgi:prepilin-type N-terminal cleavage/methylation domain-containing protein
VFSRRTLKRSTKTRRLLGFSLVELLIAVLILGIIAAIAVSKLIGAQASAVDRQAKENLKKVEATISSDYVSQTQDYSLVNSASLQKSEPDLWTKLDFTATGTSSPGHVSVRAVTTPYDTVVLSGKGSGTNCWVITMSSTGVTTYTLTATGSSAGVCNADATSTNTAVTGRAVAKDGFPANNCTMTMLALGFLTVSSVSAMAATKTSSHHMKPAAVTANEGAAPAGDEAKPAAKDAKDTKKAHKAHGGAKKDKAAGTDGTSAPAPEAAPQK